MPTGTVTRRTPSAPTRALTVILVMVGHSLFWCRITSTPSNLSAPVAGVSSPLQPDLRHRRHVAGDLCRDGIVIRDGGRSPEPVVGPMVGQVLENERYRG